MTKTTDLYNVGLLETMCFHGVNQINYWYMKGEHLYHCDQANQWLHRKLLGQNYKINLYSSTVWEDV